MKSAPATAFVLLWTLVHPSFAHPIPDLPVRTAFDAAGNCEITVEVDPRCFDEDPEVALSLTKADFEFLDEAGKESLIRKAAPYVQQAIAFEWAPEMQIQPQFEFRFTGQEGREVREDEDVMVLTGTWRTKVPEAIQAYRIRALPEGELSVLFINRLADKPVKRLAVLFPGEESYLLDLSELRGGTPRD